MRDVLVDPGAVENGEVHLSAAGEQYFQGTYQMNQADVEADLDGSFVDSELVRIGSVTGEEARGDVIDANVEAAAAVTEISDGVEEIIEEEEEKKEHGPEI